MVGKQDHGLRQNERYILNTDSGVQKKKGNKMQKYKNKKSVPDIGKALNTKYDHSGLCLNVPGGYCKNCLKHNTCMTYKKYSGKGP